MTDWGEWQLGDLSDALRRATAQLGTSAPAARVSIYPPDAGEDLPWVQITVPDEAAVSRLRRELSDGEYLPHFLADSSGSEFQAEIDEVNVDVHCGPTEPLMRRIGSLNEWSRYLDAKSDGDAAAALTRLSREIDSLYDEVGRVASRLIDSPTGEVGEVLLIARTALAEAAGMLDSVRSRFDAGGRESA